MTIIVQRAYRVAPDRHEEFERLGAGQRWPALHTGGVPMVAFGGWTFGGRRDELTAHFGYVDFAHLEAVHPHGVLDGEITAGGAGDTAAAQDGLASNASARVIELGERLGDMVGNGVAPHEGAAAPGAPDAALPPTFDRGSIVSERSYAVTAAAQAEFLRLSQELLWPWLEQHGARMIGFGHDPFGPSEQLVTLFAFRSLADWYRLSRPEPELSPPPEMVEGWQLRSALIQHHWGRLLTVATDYGQPV